MIIAVMENVKSKSMKIDNQEIHGYKIYDDKDNFIGFQKCGVLVRCNDCVYYDEYNHLQCNKFRQSVNADDYCNYGERKRHKHRIGE